MLKTVLSLSALCLVSQFALAELPSKEKLAELKGQLASRAMQPLKNVGGMCLNVVGDVNNKGNTLQTAECNDKPNQKWLLEEGRLRNQGGKCLDVAGDVKNNGSRLQTWDCNDAPNQKWRFDEGRLRNEGGKCMNLIGDFKAPGRDLEIWDCNDSPNEQWQFK